MKKTPHQSQIPNNMIPARYPSRLMGRYSISSRLIHLGLAISSILNAPSSWAAPKSKNPSSDTISKLPIAKPPETIILKDGDRVTLTAAPVREKIKGKWMRRFAYNGMIPGPKFIATEKTKIQLTLVNEIGIPTTLHSHGLRGTDRNDGVVGIGQGPILNHESFTYDLVFPDTGLFWYHPHLTEELTQEMGLQGTYLVIPKEANATLSPPRHEIIVLDDLLVEGGKLPHFTHGETSYALMGRYGNHLLVNNQMANNQYAAKMTASANEVMRFYIVNTANARPFRISMSNAQMKVVGGDNGFYEKEFLADELIISPAERLIVDVKFLNPGVASLSHRSTKIRTPLLKIKVGPAPSRPEVQTGFLPLRVRSEVTSDMESVRKLLPMKPDFHMAIDAKLSGQHAAHMSMGTPPEDGIEWEDTMSSMSAEMTEKQVAWIMTDVVTGKTNMDINWKFTEGKPVKIKIDNFGKTHPMQHPIHFHGQRFVVISRNGVPQENLAWKDTALIPAGQTMDLVLDNLNPGRWMGHCHIAEHLAVGMMFGFEVAAKESK